VDSDEIADVFDAVVDEVLPERRAGRRVVGADPKVDALGSAAREPVGHQVSHTAPARPV
jgi:hypothetical protein